MSSDSHMSRDLQRVLDHPMHSPQVPGLQKRTLLALEAVKQGVLTPPHNSIARGDSRLTTIATTWLQLVWVWVGGFSKEKYKLAQAYCFSQNVNVACISCLNTNLPLNHSRFCGTTFPISGTTRVPTQIHQTRSQNNVPNSKKQETCVR